MTESLRQLVEELIYGRLSDRPSPTDFFLRHGLPPPGGCTRLGGWWQTCFMGERWAKHPKCSGETRSAAYIMQVVAGIELEGREAPPELRAVASVLLAEDAACVGWRAPGL